MSNIVNLPTAAGNPVVNAKQRGRYPQNVIKMRTGIYPGLTAVVTASKNRGIPCEVLRRVRAPKDEFGIWFEVKSLGRLFTGVVSCNTGETRPPCDTLLFPARSLRRSLPIAKDSPREYALPAWPARWEKALARQAGSEK